MQLGECSANPQTEPEAPMKTVDILFLLDKWLEQPARQSRIEADTAVFDPKNGMATLHPETDPNTSVRGRELDGVGEKIVNDLPQADAVASNIAGQIGNLAVQIRCQQR